MIHIEKFVFNHFQVNCYVLYNETGECIIVDSSVYTEDEKLELIRFIGTKKLSPFLLVNTHGHVDHIPGNQFLKDKYSLKIAMHRGDIVLLNNAERQGLIFGFYISNPQVPDIFLEKDQKIYIGSSELMIKHAPGHSPGSVMVYSKEENFIITGDVLFEGSIGRTDFPGGDYETLINSIHQEILTLPDETIIYPGHGPSTTVGNERRKNPFLQ